MWINYFLSSFLSWLFPPSKDVAAIEAMSPSTFASTAMRVLDELPQGIFSLFKYKDSIVRTALWEVKYNGNRTIAKLFATLLYEHMLEILSEAELFENFSDPIIIPLPLSKERFRERGWNQAHMIAQELIKLYPHYELRTDILLKIKHTKPQTRLARNERLKNLAGCFAVDTNKISEIHGRNIILIDDVVTTGSTIIEARRTLLASGARAVLAFTIAH